MSPRKVRLVADMIRGRNVGEALSILKFTPNRAAGMIAKVIQSAAANAVDRDETVNPDLLVVSETQINEGPTMKRFQPKDRGRAHRILKRSSHIIVTVEEGK
jgi:large subunit ribosomal protein L22